jgi:hypothetical protein
MAFSTKTRNGRVVKTELVTLATGAMAYGSVIDFVPKGKDFTAFINTSLVNTAGAVPTDLQVSWDGVTFVTLTADWVVTCDTVSLVKAYVASTSGDFPYYRLGFDCAGADAATQIYVRIVVGD